jgi:hypothetical protein
MKPRWCPVCRESLVEALEIYETIKRGSLINRGTLIERKRRCYECPSCNIRVRVMQKRKKS